MAWGDGKPEGNGGNSCPQASHPPAPLALGRSTSTCRRTSFQHPLATIGAVMLTGASARPEGWGASRQLRLYVALRLPTPPDERYPHRSKSGCRDISRPLLDSDRNA